MTSHDLSVEQIRRILNEDKNSGKDTACQHHWLTVQGQTRDWHQCSKCGKWKEL